MNLRCLLIDDEPLAHEILRDYCAEVPFLDLAGRCFLATEALKFLNDQPVDLIFLDIQMPKIQGLDFLRTLNRPPLVIITSAYEEYALESYDLNVVDYLLKPFRFDRFLKAANRALDLHTLKNHRFETGTGGATSSGSEQLFIKTDKRLVQLSLNDINHLESYGNYVKVWLDDQFHLTPRTLSSFENQLPWNRFLRIHKSFIINLDHLDFLEGNRIVMKNGKQLPIGKNYRAALRSQLGDSG